MVISWQGEGEKGFLFGHMEGGLHSMLDLRVGEEKKEGKNNAIEISFTYYKSLDKIWT